MYLYHYVDKKLQGKYDIVDGHTIDDVFEQTKDWPGVRLILVKG